MLFYKILLIILTAFLKNFKSVLLPCMGMYTCHSMHGGGGDSSVESVHPYPFVWVLGIELKVPDLCFTLETSHCAVTSSSLVCFS